MKEWIPVYISLPKIDVPYALGHHEDDFDNTWVVDLEGLRSVEVEVAEQKGNFYEEDVGRLHSTGWATNCDNVTHWRPK